MKTAPTKSLRGFTLIELLVTITIIAIMATIGVTAYSTSQASARDGRRRSEVEQIGKAIELLKDGSTGIYRYLPADFTADFGRGASAQLLVYTDPSGLPYCIRSATTTGVSTTVPSDWTGATCPTTPAAFDTLAVSIGGSAGNNKLYNNDVRSWILCAHLERTTTPFCVNSAQ